MKYSGILLTTVLLASCSRVPDGAKFERTGMILSDERLELPWISLAPGKQKWCFTNLRFSGSRAIVALELKADVPFDPRNVGGFASLEISDSAGQSVFRIAGPLQDPCCEPSTADGDVWASEYFHYAKSPHRNVKVSYYGDPEIFANVDMIGKYCVALDVSTQPPALDKTRARVVLGSTWK